MPDANIFGKDTNQMKNKIIIILSIILLFMFYLGYRGFATYYLMTEAGKMFQTQGADFFAKENSIWNIKMDNDNFPEYAKKFMPDEKYQKDITDIGNLIYDEKNIYGSYFESKLLEKTKKILPTNLSDYKNTLIPIIKNKMESPKNDKSPTYKECFELPGSPKSALFRYTGRYWYVLSRYIEVNNKDSETSLLLGLAILYLSKDMVTNYSQSFASINRALCLTLYRNACDIMLIWASKPKNQYGSLSKRVAKDILDFVKCEYPISSLFENTKNSSDADLQIIFKHFAKGWLRNYNKTSFYKEYLHLLYEKPQKFIDKPLYELEKELNEMEKDERKVFRYFDAFQTEPVKSILRVFFSTEDVVVTRFFISQYPNLRKLKREYENTLAKMEFTAIALVINSFYAEKNRLPGSIEELSSWFGEEFPKNRLTGEPYKLDLEGMHLLKNDKYSIKLVDELVFDFIR